MRNSRSGYLGRYNVAEIWTPEERTYFDKDVDLENNLPEGRQSIEEDSRD